MGSSPTARTTVFAIYSRPLGGDEWRLRTWRDTREHAAFSTRWFERPGLIVMVQPVEVDVVANIPRTLVHEEAVAA